MMPEDESGTAIYAPAAIGTVTPVVSFDASDGELPEGLAADRYGDLYVSLSALGEIWKIAADGGSRTRFARIELAPDDAGVLGLTFDNKNVLYAGVSSFDPAINGVWQISEGGHVRRITGTEVIGLPNDLTFDNRGNLYVTDSATGSIWMIDRRGDVSLWIQHEQLEGTGDFGIGVPIGANGIEFVTGRKSELTRGQRGGRIGSFLVAVTETGKLVDIPLLPDGSAGELSVVFDDPEQLVGLDGIRLDPAGTLYGAVNVQNRIVRFDGGIHTVADDGLDFPASLDFGRRGGDRHSLYVTNFAAMSMADPGVVKVETGPPARGRTR